MGFTHRAAHHLVEIGDAPPDKIEVIATVLARHLNLQSTIYTNAVGTDVSISGIDAVFDYGKTIVGHVTRKDATLWFCRHGDVPADDHHQLRFRPKGGTWTSVPLVLEPTRVNSKAVTLSSLPADTSIEYEVWLEGALTAHGGGAVALRRRRGRARDRSSASAASAAEASSDTFRIRTGRVASHRPVIRCSGALS